MYICPKCQTEFSAEQATAANYYCTPCKRFLCAQTTHPNVVVAAPAIAPEPEPAEAAAVDVTPPSLADLFGAAIASQALDTPRPDEPAPVRESAGEAPVEPLTPRGPVNIESRPAPATRIRPPAPGNISAGAAEVSSAHVAPPLRDSNSQGSPPGLVRAQKAVDDGRPARALVVALVQPGQRNLKDAAAIEQLAGTLARLPSPVSFEIASDGHGQRKLLVRGAPEALEHVRASLFAVYAQIEIDTLSWEEDPAETLTAAGGELLGAILQNERPAFLPFKMWREFTGNDPLVAVLGAFKQNDPDEMAISQLVVHGAAPADWANEHLEQLVRLKRRGFGGDSPMPAGAILRRGVLPMVAFMLMVGVLLWAWGDGLRLVIGFVMIAALLAGVAFLTQGRNYWAGAMEDDAASKLREQALRVDLRLFARAPTRERALLTLNRLASTYALFNTTSGNAFAVMPVDGMSPLALATPRLPGLTRWHAGHPAASMTLSVKEIAGLWHMPVAEAVDLVERQKWERLLPDNIQDVSDPRGRRIGASRKGDVAVPVSLSREALQRNIVIIGKTRHGKTTLMEHVAADWMHDENRSVMIIDPHGDLAREVIGFIPPHRINDVIYIDLTDRKRTVALNLLDVEGGEQPDELAERFINVGKALWENFWGPRMLIPLGFGLRALAHANLRRKSENQFTILSLSDLLNCNDDCRQLFLNREIPFDNAPDLHKYFMGEYMDTSASHREQVIAPVLSKAHAFERSDTIRNLVGQPRSTIRLVDAIRAKKIIILNINSGVLGDDMAGFIGSLFLNVMHGVIMSQTTLPPEQRVRVSVVVDEFQKLRGADFGTLLGETGKNGGNFCFGTQSLDNLRAIEEDGTLPGKVFAGVTTTVVFQCNGDDARYLVETELDYKRLSPESLTNLPMRHAYVKTVSPTGERIPVVSVEFDPPPAHRSAVAAAVTEAQAAYTIPADIASKQAKESTVRFMTEYEHVSFAETDKARQDHKLQPAVETLERMYRTRSQGRETATPAPVPAMSSTGGQPNPAQRAEAAAATQLPRLKPPIGQKVDNEANLRAALNKLVGGGQTA